MKIKDGFVLRSVSDAYVVIALGDAAKNFHGMITLNESGALLWKTLAAGCDGADALVAALLAEYEITPEIASRDVGLFLDRVRKAGLLAE